jgi:hypothetical protein
MEDDGMYGGEEQDRFEAEEFDQDFMDGGVREDVRKHAVVYSCCLQLPLFRCTVGPTGWPRPG